MKKRPVKLSEKKLAADIGKIVDRPLPKPPRRKPLRGSFETAVARKRGTSLAS